jgi:ankyrin repeat protein
MGASIDEVLAFARAAAAGDVMEIEELLDQQPALTDEPAVAAMLGDDEQLAGLLSQDSSGAGRDLRDGITPLFLTCMSQYGGDENDWSDQLVSCARLLIENGAALHTGPTDHDLGGRSTPLAAAVSALAHAPLCELLLESGAPPSDVPALVVGVARQRWDCIDLLLAHGADWNTLSSDGQTATLHRLLDVGGLPAESLQRMILGGADPNLAVGSLGETALHIAVRRRRVELIAPLMESGAAIEATTTGGMTAFRHAVRRTFLDIAEELIRLGADTSTTPADELATALWSKDMDQAWHLLLSQPELGTTGPPEERRLLPDLAAMNHTEALVGLIDAGWELDARGLDGGTALHTACWFASEDAARLLVERGAPLDLRGDDHDCTPLGWVAHGSVACGGADTRGAEYARLAELLLSAGAPLPGPEDRHDHSQFAGAAEAVREVLETHGWSTAE